MPRQTTEEKLASLETRIAAILRQLVRAHDADDQPAVTEESIRVSAMLSSLLEVWLEREPTWNSRENWIDSLIGSRVVVNGRNRITVSGRIAWGLSENVGGDQWADPFDAEFQINWQTSRIRSYILRFSDYGDSDTKRLESGFYETLAGSGQRILIGRIPGSGNSKLPKPMATASKPGSVQKVIWLYEFCKHEMVDDPPKSHC